MTIPDEHERADLDRRSTDKWQVDKRINMPTIIGFGGVVFSIITWGNAITASSARQEARIVTVESSQVQNRAEQAAIRAELINQQNQSRIELTQQLNKIEAEIKGEIRELRNSQRPRTP